MGLFGDLIQSAMGGFPSKPNVPAWQNLSLSNAQTQAIAANQAALPASQGLVSGVNQFTRDQIQQMLEQAIPGFQKIAGSASSTISDLLAGKIPGDVQQAVQSASAARAVGGGYGGTGMHSNLVARDLGLTSLDLTGKGLSSAQSWLQTMNSIYSPGMMNVSSMFISPMQQFETEMQNQEAAWGVNWLQNQINALPDPATAAISKDLGGMADTAAMAIPYFGAFYGASSMGGGGGIGSLLGGGGGGGLGGLIGGGGGQNMADPSAISWYQNQPASTAYDMFPTM